MGRAEIYFKSALETFKCRGLDGKDLPCRYCYCELRDVDKLSDD